MWKQTEVPKGVGLINEQVESLSKDFADLALSHRVRFCEKGSVNASKVWIHPQMILDVEHTKHMTN